MKKTVQTNYVKYGELRQIKGVTTIIRADIAGKQDKLTTVQMAAVDSGITAAKVLSYDNAASLAHSHANKTSVLDKLWWNAQNNAVCIGDAEHPINFCAFGAVTAGGVGFGGSGGQGGISTIYLGSTRYDAAQGSSAIYLPAYPTQVTWANIPGKPSWIGSSKPSYAFGEITGTAAAAQIPSLAISKITGLQDALDGKVSTTTLSTWAGSSHITTLGTIATGVWHGTAIGDLYIASATNWNDAYNKRHSHSNKTVLDSITAQDLIDLRNLASWIGIDSNNNVYVKKDGNNNARNFYVFGAITAGGVGSGGIGGGGISTIYLGTTRYDAAQGSSAIYLPAYPTQVTWANISGKPSWIGSSKPSYAFGELTSHPTTVAGYGITDIDQQSVVALTTASLRTETDIVESGLRTYYGSGSTWIGSVTSMAYAAIIALGPGTGRGLQIWARRGAGITASLRYRVPNADNTEWASERIVIDSENYTTYCATAAQGAKADTAYGWGNHASAGYAAVSSLSNYLPLAGGTITGTISMDGYATNIPFVRNFTNTVNTGWERKVAAIRVDGVDKFRIGAYGSYVAGATDNGISYAYIGCNAYDGLNLRLTATSIQWGNNGIYHAGNANLSTVAWTCSTLTASGNITGALLKSTNNGNTVTIGSQNSGFCHIYNSADIPFIFNKDIQTYGGLIPFDNGSHPLGNSTHVWGDAYLTNLYASGNATIAGSLSMGDTLTMGGNEVLFASSPTLYVNRGLQTRTVDFFGTNVRFRISGNMGLGTTSPGAKFHAVTTGNVWTGLFTSDNTAVYLAHGSGPGIYIGSKINSSSSYLMQISRGQTTLGSGGTVTFYIRGDGHIGVGTTSVSEMFNVAGNIVATGAITAGAASDARLKDNIRNLANAVTVLKSLRPVSFDWNATATSNFSELKGHDVGLIAQEVEPYIPSAIGTIFEDYKRLDYAKVTPYLIAGWQDHESRIATLERENAELKRRLNIN